MSKLKYLNGAISALKWAILYPIDANNSLWKKILYYFWCVFFISSFVITVIQCVVELVIQPFSIIGQSAVIMNIGIKNRKFYFFQQFLVLVVIFVTLFMNFVIFFYHSDNVVALVNNINVNFLEKADNGVEDFSMEYYIQFSDKFALYCTMSMICSASYTGISPLLSGVRTLPVPGWFPYDTTKSPFFEISYFWQVLCQFNLGLIYGASDMIFPAMTIVIGYQFKVLASNFKNSFYYSIWKCGISKEVIRKFKNQLEREDLLVLYERYKDIYAVISRNEYHQILLNYFKRNIRHHQLLLECSENLNKIMELFLMTKILTAFFNMTLILFIVITSGDNSQVMALSSYLTFGTFEVFLYTYGGEILTQNADFLSSLYEAPWYLYDPQFRKLFLVVHMRVSKMIYTKAGNYFPMCAPMFISFMRTIYSYAALMKELVK